MTGKSPQSEGPQARSGQDKGQGALVLFLLLVGVCSGSYYFGTQMNFARMEGSAGGSGGTGQFFSFAFPTAMKKNYWIHTKGYDRAGYTVTVSINGQEVDKFYKPDVNVDVTRFIKPGKNVIVFNAKSLPLDQRDDNQSAYLTLELRSAEKTEKENSFEGGDVLVDYTRQVTDTEDMTDKKEFEPIE